MQRHPVGHTQSLGHTSGPIPSTHSRRHERGSNEQDGKNKQRGALALVKPHKDTSTWTFTVLSHPPCPHTQLQDCCLRDPAQTPRNTAADSSSPESLVCRYPCRPPICYNQQHMHTRTHTTCFNHTYSASPWNASTASLSAGVSFSCPCLDVTAEKHAPGASIATCVG